MAGLVLLCFEKKKLLLLCCENTRVFGKLFCKSYFGKKSTIIVFGKLLYKTVVIV